jgi:hypothetical protein
MTGEHDSQAPEAESAKNRKAAMLALLVADAKPDGPAPTLAEIDAWQNGRLDPVRGEQVKSHLARTPEALAMFTEMLATERMQLTETQPRSLPGGIMRVIKGFRFRNPIWLAGAATAAVLVLSVVLVTQRGHEQPGFSPLPPQYLASLSYSWPWGAQAISRGGSQATPDQRQAFQAGLRQGLQELTRGEGQWGKAISGLAREMPECESATNATACRQATETLRDTGQTAAGLYLACLAWEAGMPDQTPFDAAYWQGQPAQWQAIENKLQGVADPEAWARVVSELAHTDLDNRSSLCLGIIGLIDMGASK